MTDIVSVPSGDFTPGALAALQYPAALINAAWNQANAKYDSFETKMGLVTNVGGTGWLDEAATPTVTATSATATAATDPGVTELPTIPTVVTAPTAPTLPTLVDLPTAPTLPTLAAATVMTLFDDTQQALWDQLVAGIGSFRTTYFPDEQANFDAAEAWLAASLASPSGLPTAVAAQMLTDDKDRIAADASRASDALMAKFAGSRFPMPTGALASAVLQVQQVAQAEVAASSRKITIASIENLRFAVTQLVGLRQIALGAALEYVKTLASGMPIAGQVAGTSYGAQAKAYDAQVQSYGAQVQAFGEQVQPYIAQVQAYNAQVQARAGDIQLVSATGNYYGTQAALTGAASQYYNARTAAAEMLAKNSQFNAEKTLQAATSNQGAELAMVENKLKAMMSELQALAQMTTSLFNNLHVSSGTGYSVSGTWDPTA